MAEYELELLQGTVQAVTFENPENGYAVLRLLEESGEMITVVGTIPMAFVGERLIVTGKWTFHPTYGKQFEAEFLERLMPESCRDILAYLSSGMVKGIGPVTAERIVKKFSEKSLDILESNPEKLAEVEGISRKKAFAVSDAFSKQIGVRRLIEFLMGHGLPAEIAARLYRYYGAAAMEVISQDPYLMTEPFLGADFSSVDTFALELGFSEDDDRRAEAGTVFELTYNLTNGHVFIPREKLVEATAQLLSLSAEKIEPALDRLEKQKRIVCDLLLERPMVYLREFYQAENEICRRLKDLSSQTYKAPKNLPELLERIAEHRPGGYAPLQMRAMEDAAKCGALIVTGGPGTGKTTTMAGILELFDLLGLKTVLAAPTGRAAKRLSACTGREATTIHRLLECALDPELGEIRFTRDKDNPLPADALIVDEASMIDLMLMHNLLGAMKPSARIVFVGDPDQLPSVAAGNVFSDMIRSGAIRTVRLTEIFRQARESLIVMNAHAVNAGQMPELSVKDKDFFFLRRLDAEGLVTTVQQLCAERLPKNMGISPADIQVLSPTRKGITGTANLNKALQAVLNPAAAGKKEKLFGDYAFREGDRVMQIRNNYDITWRSKDGKILGTGIFNGDIGTVLSVNHALEILTIDFEDRLADYSFDMLSELEPAFAMTVHKSQGSEYRAVILTALGGSPYLFTRSILYTALTRAKELLIIVGSEEVIAAMVRNDKQQRRYSGLKLRLEGSVGQ